MNRIASARHAGKFVVLVALLLFPSARELRADPILSTLGDTPGGSSPESIRGAGEKITISSSNNISLTSIVFNQPSDANASAETLGIYTTSPATGSALPVTFTSSYNSTSYDNTFSPTSSFTFSAGQTYYLYLSYTSNIPFSYTTSATAGQLSNSYASIISGVYNNGGTFGTATNAQGVLEFQLNGTPLAVPEPSSLSLAAIAGVLGSVVAYRRRRGARISS